MAGPAGARKASRSRGRQGEIWERGKRPTLALILSSDFSNEAGPVRVIVYPVVPGKLRPADELTGDVAITVPLKVVVLPELIEWLPPRASRIRAEHFPISAWQRVEQIKAVLGEQRGLRGLPVAPFACGVTCGRRPDLGGGPGRAAPA